MNPLEPCLPDTQGRRRLFWTFQTQCDHFEGECGEECAIPQHRLNRITDAGGSFIGATIDTSNYVRSLALAILLTDNTVETPLCPIKPGLRGGHWADCYRGDNRQSGSTIRDIETQCSVAQARSFLRSAVSEDLGKMVLWGIVSEVIVEVEYIGGNIFEITAELVAYQQNITVTANAKRLDGAWIWETQPQR